MATITKIKWKDANFKWNDAKGDAAYEAQTGHVEFTWNEVFLVEEVVEAIQQVGGNVLEALESIEPEKKKRFIKLVCKVKGIETYSGQKTIRDDIEISAEDVQVVIKEVLGIDLTVENIHV